MSPAPALDPFRPWLSRIDQGSGDYTIVIVTHNIQQAARIADYTAFFNLKAVGQPGHLEYFSRTPSRCSTTRKTKKPTLHLWKGSADRFLRPVMICAWEKTTKPAARRLSYSARYCRVLPFSQRSELEYFVELGGDFGLWVTMITHSRYGPDSLKIAIMSSCMANRDCRSVRRRFPASVDRRRTAGKRYKDGPHDEHSVINFLFSASVEEWSGKVNQGDRWYWSDRRHRRCRYYRCLDWLGCQRP